ncbi:13777_t:CDS:1, partial [Cetraspora pellucida]
PTRSRLRHVLCPVIGHFDWLILRRSMKFRGGLLKISLAGGLLKISLADRNY